MSVVKDLDAQTTENLIFFLQNKGEIRNTTLVQRIMQNIEDESWIETGAVRDTIILVRLLNEHRSFFTMEKLWDQLE